MKLCRGYWGRSRIQRHRLLYRWGDSTRSLRDSGRCRGYIERALLRKCLCNATMLHLLSDSASASRHTLERRIDHGIRNTKFRQSESCEISLRRIRHINSHKVFHQRQSLNDFIPFVWTPWSKNHCANLEASLRTSPNVQPRPSNQNASAAGSFNSNI